MLRVGAVAKIRCFAPFCVRAVVVALVSPCQCRRDPRAHVAVLFFGCVAFLCGNVVEMLCHCCREDVSVPMSSYCDAAVISLRIVVPKLIALVVPLSSARLGQGLGVSNQQSERARKTV